MKKRIIIAALVALAACSVFTGCGGNDSSGDQNTPAVESSVSSKKEKSSSNKSEQAASNQNTSSKEETVTVAQQNAIRTAEHYLSFTAFSKSGLINQLKFEGYSTEDAEYAAAHCGANWKEQAAKKAEEYLRIMGFSKSRLIEQLEFEGFPSELVLYGVEQNGY